MKIRTMSMKRMEEWVTRGVIRLRRFLEVKVATLHSPPAGEPKKIHGGVFVWICVDLFVVYTMWLEHPLYLESLAINHIIVASK